MNTERIVDAERAKALRPTLSVAETAELLGVSTWLVLKQINSGELPAIRVGRRILISRVRLLAWLEAS